MARPKPLPAPVTIATCPSNLLVICHFLLISRLALVTKRGQAFGEVLAVDMIVVSLDLRAIAVIGAMVEVGQREPLNGGKHFRTLLRANCEAMSFARGNNRSAGTTSLTRPQAQSSSADTSAGLKKSWLARLTGSFRTRRTESHPRPARHHTWRDRRRSSRRPRPPVGRSKEEARALPQPRYHSRRR